MGLKKTAALLTCLSFSLLQPVPPMFAADIAATDPVQQPVSTVSTTGDAQAAPAAQTLTPETPVATSSTDFLATNQTLSLSATSSDTAPVAVAPTVPAFNEDTPQSITLAGTDADNNPLTYTIVSGPSHGTLVRDATNYPNDSTKYLYTPATNYNGTDSFTFKVNDGTADSDVATVSLNINAVNDAPVVTGVQNMYLGQNGSFTLATDVDKDVLVYSYSALPAGATLNTSTGKLSWTPSVGQVGVHHLTVIVDDQHGGTVEKRVDIVVRDPASPAMTFRLSRDETSDFSTIQAAADIALPGDRILIKGGTTWDASYFPLTIKAKGTVEAPIYFGVDKSWYEGSTWTPPVFILGGAKRPFSIYNAENIIIDGFDIQGQVINQGVESMNGGIFIYGSKNITVKNVYLHDWVVNTTKDSMYGGIVASSSTNVVVDSSVVKGTLVTGELGSGTGFYANSCTGVTLMNSEISDVTNGVFDIDLVHDNHIHHIRDSFDPVQHENGVWLNPGARFYNNLFHDIQAMPIYVIPGWGGVSDPAPIWIYNNVAYNTEMGGGRLTSSPITIDPSQATSTTMKVYIFNNILERSESSLIKAGSRLETTPPLELLDIRNNLFITPASAAISLYMKNDPNDPLVDNNSGFKYYTVSNLIEQNNILLTPEQAAAFGLTRSNYFKPPASIPGITDAGQDLSGLGLFDFDLNNLRRSGAWDIGAYEYMPTTNQTPVAVAPVIPAFNEDTAQAVTLGGSDADNNPLTYSIVTGPAHGTLVRDPAFPDDPTRYLYTPSANYNGTDSFTYKVNDGTADSNVAIVSLTINAVNDAPVSQDVLVEGSEDTLITGRVSAEDVDGDSLTYQLVAAASLGTGLSVESQGDFSLNADGTFRFLPAPGYAGTLTYSYVASDGKTVSAQKALTIKVNPVNDAPVAEAKNVTLNENSPQTITLSGTDADGDALRYIIVTQPEHGQLICSEVNGSGISSSRACAYIPEANYHGTDSFTYKVNDGKADSEPATVNLTIKAVNDAPVVQSAVFTGNEDAVITGRLSGTDVDGDTLNYSLIGDALEGLVCNQDGSFTYTPAKDFNGEVNFQYKANDGTEDSEPASVTLTIEPVNDQPVILDALLGGTEDALLTGSVTGSDADGDGLTYRIVGTIPEGLTLNQDGTFSYRPVANFFGTVTFDYVANDGLTDSEAARVTMNIDPVNDIPTANAMAVSTDEDSAGSFTLTGTDADGDQLIYSVVDKPSHGTLSCSGANCTYTPTADYNGTDTVSFRVFDGTAYSEPKAVTITINAVNDAPVITPVPKQYATVGNELRVPIIVTDIDSEYIALSGVSLPEGARIENGYFIWTPAAGRAKNYTVTFRASDGALYSEGSFQISVSKNDGDGPSKPEKKPRLSSVTTGYSSTASEEEETKRKKSTTPILYYETTTMS